MSYASQHSNLPTGPFSGVNLSCILDKTTLESEVGFEADAHAFLLLGHGPDRKGWRHRSLRESMPRSAWTDKTGRNLVQGKQCDRNGQGHP